MWAPKLYNSWEATTFQKKRNALLPKDCMTKCSNAHLSPRSIKLAKELSAIKVSFANKDKITRIYSMMKANQYKKVRSLHNNNSFRSILK